MEFNLANIHTEKLIEELKKRGAKLIECGNYKDHEVTVREKYSNNRNVEVLRNNVLVLPDIEL